MLSSTLGSRQRRALERKVRKEAEQETRRNISRSLPCLVGRIMDSSTKTTEYDGPPPPPPPFPLLFQRIIQDKPCLTSSHSCTKLGFTKTRQHGTRIFSTIFYLRKNRVLEEFSFYQYLHFRISARDYNDQDEYDQHGVRIDHQYIA